MAESIKRIKLKMEEEKIGISEFLDYSTIGSGIKANIDAR